MIELKSGETVTVHAPTAAGNGAGINPGEPVRLAWPPDASLVLDASDRAPASTLS
jgi:TOBE domain